MSDVRSYAGVTGCYWVFTLTDGALRMLVLLHFHDLGFDAIEIAFLFLLYEAMGIITNFAGGWLAALVGLKRTLYLGLWAQIGALLMLSFIQAEWTLEFSVVYVMASQALSGVAKDLTKMSSKSAVKLVVSDDSHGLLFKWIALLTGSKNTLKGIGFFLGGVMLSALGFKLALWVMAGALVIILIIANLTIRGDMGKTKEKVRARHLFSKTRNINVLSVARVFLFASRDVWFVVGVPIFLTSVMGWSFAGVGGFMAAWIIGYGIVQASVPKLLRGVRDLSSALRSAKLWAFVLVVIPAGIAIGLPSPTALLGGLGVFAIIFAINSAVHSYLIVACSDADKVTLNVGFYYMANAAGRLMGTFLSGAIYQYAGLEACLWVSSLLVLICAMVSLGLHQKSESLYGAT